MSTTGQAEVRLCRRPNDQRGHCDGCCDVRGVADAAFVALTTGGAGRAI
jgi:hypothetical protein